MTIPCGQEKRLTEVEGKLQAHADLTAAKFIDVDRRLKERKQDYEKLDATIDKLSEIVNSLNVKIAVWTAGGSLAGTGGGAAVLYYVLQVAQSGAHP